MKNLLFKAMYLYLMSSVLIEFNYPKIALAVLMLAKQHITPAKKLDISN
jgi:hypothetical protein